MHTKIGAAPPILDCFFDSFEFCFTTSLRIKKRLLKKTSSLFLLKSLVVYRSCNCLKDSSPRGLMPTKMGAYAYKNGGKCQ